MKFPISVTILTRNNQKYLNEVLAALQIFDEILIFDSGSQDETLKITRTFPNVCIHEGTFIGFGPTHNLASSLARHDWILSIDSDEIVTPALAKEIEELQLQRDHVYSFPRHNEYRGVWVRWCGWHPDRQIRLYNRLDTKFTDAQVHEAIDASTTKEIFLHSPLRHYSYENISDFLHKMQTYSTLFALQYQGKRSSSLCKALFHGIFAFIKSYFVKKGFLGKQVGFEISFYNANTAFYKYLKLAEANRQIKAAEKCGDDQRKKQV